jgi:hypothetical protein
MTFGRKGLRESRLMILYRDHGEDIPGWKILSSADDYPVSRSTRKKCWVLAMTITNCVKAHASFHHENHTSPCAPKWRILAPQSRGKKFSFGQLTWLHFRLRGSTRSSPAGHRIHPNQPSDMWPSPKYEDGKLDAYICTTHANKNIYNGKTSCILSSL